MYFRSILGMITVCCLLVMVPATEGWSKPNKNGKAKAPAASAPYAPITVMDSINATLHNHRNIKILQENRSVLEDEVTRAKAGYGPRLDVTARGGLSQLDNSTTRGINSNDQMYPAGSVSLTLTQPIFDGYTTLFRVREAKSTLTSLEHRVFDNGTSLALDAIIAHLDILRLRRIVALSENNVQRHEELLASTRDREQTGTDTMAEVTQTEGRLSRAISTLVGYKASLRSAEVVYQRLTNQPVPGKLADVPPIAPAFPDLEAVLLTAEKENPKIKAYMSDIKAAEARQGQSEAAFYPNLSVEAGPTAQDRLGRNYESHDQWSNSFEVMGVMRWNLFNSGADAANVSAQAGRIRQARQTLYNLMDDLKRDGQETWVRYREAEHLTKTYTEAVRYNMLTKDSYLEQFYIGSRRLLDVLDAENELFNSSTQLATSQSNILVGMYKLYALAGVLLQTMQVDTSVLQGMPQTTETAPDMRQQVMKDWKF